MTVANPTPAPGTPPGPRHDPEPVDLASESVAGEEDPGSVLDLPDEPGPCAPPAQPAPSR